MDEIYFSTDKSKLNIDLIFKYLSNSYWAQNRSREIVENTIRNSLCFGVYYKEDQIGFARVITDFSIFAYLADIFIIDEFKSKGIGKRLMKTILSHPELGTIKRWMLSTSDAQDFYKHFGFKSIGNPQKIMELVKAK